MSFPDYFRCKLPKSKFSIRIHFQRSLSEILFFCKLHRKSDVCRSFSLNKQIELFLEFWNTYHNLLGNISYLKQLVLVGNYLVENDFPFIALYICFARYLKLVDLIQHSTFSLDFSAIENIDHRDELFEFTHCAIFGFIQTSYLVLTSFEISKSIQNLISSLSEILLNLKFVSRIFIKFDTFFWLAFNSTVLIYSISLKLISFREFHTTLPFLHWSIILLEYYSSTCTPHHIEMKNLFSMTVCYVYDICRMSREAEEFARISLEKVQDNYEQFQLENSNAGLYHLSVQLLSVVFCSNVFNMRLKAKTVLKPKSRISLSDSLHLNWPRSNTERLLSELMKQGVTSYFFAILYTLTCKSHVKQNYLLNFGVSLKLDSEILLETFYEIFQAGAFILMNTFTYIEYKFRETHSMTKLKSHIEANDEIPKFVLFRDFMPFDFQSLSLNYAFIFITLSFYFDQQDVFLLISDKYLLVSELLHDNSNHLNLLTVKLLIHFNSFSKSLTFVQKDNVPDDTVIVNLKHISVLMANYSSLELNQQIRRILVDLVFATWSYISRYLSTINNYKKIVDLRDSSFQDFSIILDNLTELMIVIHFINIDPIIFEVIVIKNIILKENFCYTSNFRDPNTFKYLTKCQNILKQAIQQISNLMDVFSERINSLTLFKYFVENLFIEIIGLYIRISIRLTLLFNFESYYVFAAYRKCASSLFLRILFPTLVPLYNTLAFDKFLSCFFKIQLIAVLNEVENVPSTQKFIVDLCDTLSPFGIENSDVFIHFPILTNMCHLLRTPPTICCNTSNTVCSPPMLNLNIERNGIDIYWWALFVKSIAGHRQTVTMPLTCFKRLGLLTPYGQPMLLNLSLIQPGSYFFAVAYFDYDGKQITCLSKSTKSIYIGFNVPYSIAFEKNIVILNSTSSNSFISNSLDFVWSHILEIQLNKQSLQSIIYPRKEQALCFYSIPLLGKIVSAMLIEFALPYFYSEKSLINLSLRNTISSLNSDLAIKLFSLHKLVLMLNDTDILFKYFMLIFTIFVPSVQNFHHAASLLPSLMVIFNATLECFTSCRTLCPNKSHFRLLISFSSSFIEKLDVIGEHNLAKYFFDFISQNLSKLFTDSSYLVYTNIPESFVAVQVVQSDLTSQSKSRSSGPCLGNTVSSSKSKVKKTKNCTPTQMVREKSDFLVAFETFFFTMNSSISSLDSLEITGNEDPFILNILIASLPPTLAYNEVCKFRRRSKYIEYITKLCIRTYICGNLDLILTWSEEVFNWLQKRNEVLLTKAPLIYIQRDKISNSCMDNVLTHNYFKDSKKDNSDITNSLNFDISLTPLREDKEKRAHSIKKVTNRLQRLQIRKDDVYNKARDILSILLPSLWKSNCKRKRIRKITFAEFPWRIELFNILSATRFELLVKFFKQCYCTKSDFLYSPSFTYSSPKTHSSIVNGKILIGGGGCGVYSVRDIVNVQLPNSDGIQELFSDGTFPYIAPFNLLNNTTPMSIKPSTDTLDIKLSPSVYELFSKANNANRGDISDDSKRLHGDLSNQVDHHLSFIYHFLKKAIVLSDRSEKFLLGFNSCNILNDITQTLIGYFSTLDLMSSSLLYLVLCKACLPYFFAACTLIKIIHDCNLETSNGLNLNTFRLIIYNAIGVLYYNKRWQKLIDIIVYFNNVCDSNDLIPILIYSHFQAGADSVFDVDYYLIKLSRRNFQMSNGSSMYFYCRQIYEQYYCGLNHPLFPINSQILNLNYANNVTQEYTGEYFRKVSNVEIYPFSQIPISKLVFIYEKTIFELRESDTSAQLCCACFELANLYFIEGKENLAYYYWSFSLNSLLGFQDIIGKWTSNKLVFNDLFNLDKCLSKITILYAITICAIIGEKLFFSNLDLQIEYCLLAAHLHCLFFASFLPDPFQLILYVKFTLLEENVATFFPNLEISNSSSMVSIDISLLLYSLNWLASTLMHSGHYWQTLPILILYEFISVKIASSTIHTVLCTLRKIDVLVKLHFFKDAFFEFFFLFERSKLLYKPHSNVSFNRYKLIKESFSDHLALEHPLNSNFLFNFASMQLSLPNDTFLFPLISNLIVLSKVRFFCEIISYYQFGIGNVVSPQFNTVSETYQLNAKFSSKLFEYSESNYTFSKFIDSLNFVMNNFNTGDITHSIFSIIEYLLLNILKQIINGSIQFRLYFLIEIQVLYAQLNQLRNGIYFVIKNFLIALNGLCLFNDDLDFNQISGLFLVYHSPRYWLSLLYKFTFSLVMHVTDQYYTFLPLSTNSLLNQLRNFAIEVSDCAIYAKFTLLKAHTTLILNHPLSEAIGFLHECSSILDCTYPSIECFQNLISTLILLGDILIITSKRVNTYFQAFESILDFISTFQECNKLHCLYNPNCNIFSLLLNRLGSTILSLLRNGCLSSIFLKHSMISHNSSFYSSRFIFVHSNIQKFILDLKYSNISCSFIDYVDLINLIFNDICSTPLVQTGIITILQFLSQLIQSPFSELRIRNQLKEKYLILIKAYISIEDSVKHTMISPLKNCSNVLILHHPMNFNFIINPIHCFRGTEFSLKTFDFLFKKSINLANQLIQNLPVDANVLFRWYQIFQQSILMKPTKLLAFGHIQKIQSIWFTQLITLNSYFLLNDLTSFGCPFSFDLSSMLAYLSYTEKVYLSNYILSPKTTHETSKPPEQFMGTSNLRNFGKFDFKEYECCFIWKLALINGNPDKLYCPEFISCFYVLYGKLCRSSQTENPNILIGNFSCEIDDIIEIHQKIESLFFKCIEDIPPSNFKKTSANNVIQSLSVENSIDFRKFSLRFIRLFAPENKHPKFLDSNILSLELVKDITDVSRAHCFQSTSLYLWIESNLL